MAAPTPAPQPKEEKRTIEVKEEVVQPKILGKIDLSPKKKAEPAPAPQPKVEAPKAEEPKKEKSQQKKRGRKPKK